MAVGFFAPLTLAALALLSSITGGPSHPTIQPAVRVVDVRGAASLLARGATVLDARDAASFAQGHLPGAQPYAWQATTGQGAARGRVRPDLRSVAQALAALGVDSNRPTLVYGAAGSGWGEEGHAAWLLTLLGHTDIALLDGGFAAWRAAGRPVVTSTAVPRVGRFEPRLRAEVRASRDEVERAAQVVDVRTAVEFAGATPYGEPRAGHLPKAHHLDWRTLLDESGRVRSSARIYRALADAGIDPSREIVTYCTAGVRSAFVAVVLNARGVPHVRNYDGSLVEWGSDPSAPLVR
jgi:thiosulfate/3-mercaptopyruvate sulfurtransferase